MLSFDVKANNRDEHERLLGQALSNIAVATGNLKNGIETTLHPHRVSTSYNARGPYNQWSSLARIKNG